MLHGRGPAPCRPHGRRPGTALQAAGDNRRVRNTASSVVMRPLGPSQTRPDSPIQRSESNYGASSSGRGDTTSTNPTSSSSNGGRPLQLTQAAPSNATRSSRPTVIAEQKVPTDLVVRSAAAGAVQVLQRREQLTYDTRGTELPTDVDFKWAQDSYNATQRTVDTWVFFSVFRTRSWLLDQKWSYPGGYSEEKKSVRARGLAKYLLESILQLGPTFIKIGQLSSTRSDLFPAEFVEELSKLQDRVPAFSADKAVAIIERDLGEPIDKLFRSFERRPIAAASLGQVHRAVLYTGEEVVVKVQRPGLKALFDIDLGNLKLLAEQLDKGDENRDFKGIYQECASVLYDEIDYIKEGRNVDRFRRNFRDVPWVRTPVVYWEYCSPRVLVLEYLPGVKISDKQRLQAAGVATDLVAQRATEAYLQQILRHGFFHADPHPGNVSVDASGRLLFYDFGMMGQIVPDVRERLLELFYGIYRKDSSSVIRVLVELGVIKPTGDILSVRRAINYFLENLAQQTERQETVQTIGEDLFAIALDQPFRFPATFTFVLRAFSTLEGIGKSLNPDYNFSAVATPYAQELLQLQDAQQQQGFLIAQLQQQATEVTQAAAAMPLRVAKIDSTLAQLEAGDLKLRVRVLEGERAARRAGVLQLATMNTIGAVGFLDMGVQLALHGGLQGVAGVCLAVSAVFGVLLLRGMQRVQRLDKFEKEIRG